MKTKKDYEKPLTEVVKLQTTGILMESQQVLGLIATMNGEFVEEDI